jgi:flagellar motor switch protein FliN/FliY
MNNDPSNAGAPADRPAVQAVAFPPLADAPSAGAGLAMPELATTTQAPANPLHGIRTRLTVVLGSIELSVGELLGAREQQVLQLDRTPEQPVDVMLEGQVVARGTLVAVGDSFGVRITELPRALTP